MSEVAHHQVLETESGERLDRWLRRRFPQLTFGQLQKLLRTGQVRVDGKRVKGEARLTPGQDIRVPPVSGEPVARAKTPRPISEKDAEELKASVLYRDSTVIALNKPAGLAVQGGSGQTRSLDDLSSCLVPEGAERPRLVHRLDQDTSGVLLLALSASAARVLASAFKGRDARKTYWALVKGVPDKTSGRIDLPLAKMPGSQGEKMEVNHNGGLAALTLYATVATFGGRAAWLALSPQTGRTHQLRAHLAAIGHPILGDGKYGGKEAFLEKPPLAKNMMLHAREIAVPHPEDETTLRVTAPLPSHFSAALKALGFKEAHAERAERRLEELGA